MWVLPLLVSQHQYTLPLKHTTNKSSLGLRRPPPRLPLPHPRHRLGPLLPLRARRRTLRPRAQNPQPHDLHHHRHPNSPHPHRQTPPYPLSPQHRLPHPLPPKPAPLPLGQAHRPHIPRILRARPHKPLRVVQALQHAASQADEV